MHPPQMFLDVLAEVSRGTAEVSINDLASALEIPDATPTSSDITKKYNEMTGESESYDFDTRHTILEMQVDLDLKGFEDKDANGEDTGIALPYVVTIDSPSGIILSIRRNYYEDDQAKLRRMHFVHYQYRDFYLYYCPEKQSFPHAEPMHDTAHGAHPVTSNHDNAPVLK